MIKVIVHIAKVVITIVTSMLFFSCGFETVDGNGNVTTQSRDTGAGFTEIDAGGGIEVYISQGSAASIKVEADSNLQEHIKTKVTGSKLTISTDVSIGNASSKKVTITVPKVTAIESGSGVFLKTSGVINADDIVLSSSSGSNMEATVAAKKITAEASSGSHLQLNGKATSMQTQSSSGSTINAANLAAHNINSEASSGSNTTVNPLKSLNAEASSGSHISYTKTPDKLSKDESSGGSVSQQ